MQPPLKRKNSALAYQKWDIVLVRPDPAVGSELAKSRPAIIVSPPAVNVYMNTVVVLPLTSRLSQYPFRLVIIINGVKGEACPDQLRTIDKSRILKKLGTCPDAARPGIIRKLQDFFVG